MNAAEYPLFYLQLNVAYIGAQKADLLANKNTKNKERNIRHCYCHFSSTAANVFERQPQ